MLMSAQFIWRDLGHSSARRVLKPKKIVFLLSFIKMLNYWWDLENGVWKCLEMLQITVSIPIFFFLRDVCVSLYMVFAWLSNGLSFQKCISILKPHHILFNISTYSFAYNMTQKIIS